MSWRRENRWTKFCERNDLELWYCVYFAQKLTCDRLAGAKVAVTPAATASAAGFFPSLKHRVTDRRRLEVPAAGTNALGRDLHGKCR